MSETSGRRKTTASKPLANPKPKQGLHGQAIELQKILNSKDATEANRIITMKKDIDIPRLKKVIARYRKILALQSSILDEMEAEIKEVTRSARKKTPTKPKQRK